MPESVQEKMENAVATPLGGDSAKYSFVGPLCALKESNAHGVLCVLRTQDGREVVAKFSCYVDYLSRHEHRVMQELGRISGFCPHYCLALDFFRQPVYASVIEKAQEAQMVVESGDSMSVTATASDAGSACDSSAASECRSEVSSAARAASALAKCGNYFAAQGGMHYLTAETVVMEKIEGLGRDFSGPSLWHAICERGRDKTRFPQRMLYSVLAQCLLASEVAWRGAEFTHYDLHPANVLMERAPENEVALYVFEETSFAVATHGARAKMIDFSFSRVGSLPPDAPLYASTSQTNCGQDPLRDRPGWDAGMLLTTVCYDLSRNCPTRRDLLFCRRVRELLGCGRDPSTGWREGAVPSFRERVAAELVQGGGSKMDLLSDSLSCSDFVSVVQSMVPQDPVEAHRDHVDIRGAAEALAGELQKLELCFRDLVAWRSHLLQTLQSVVDAVRHVYRRVVRRGVVDEGSLSEAADAACRVLAAECRSRCPFDSQRAYAASIDCRKLASTLCYLAQHVETLYARALRQTRAPPERSGPLECLRELAGVACRFPVDWESAEVVVYDSVGGSRHVAGRPPRELWGALAPEDPEACGRTLCTWWRKSAASAAGGAA